MIIHLTRAAGAASMALALALFAAHPASAQDVQVDVNGAAMNFAAAPIIQDGRVFVPLRGVFEQLGASVDYSNGLITATGSDGRTISLNIGSTQANINGQPDTIDVAPFIVGSTTFVPLRFISQALGASVNWDENDHVVSIAMAGSDNANEAPPNPIQYQAPLNDDVAYAPPPPIPVYEQPEAPVPNDIWQPGYWGWGSYGYYWVPGTWVAAPQPGYLWTPGYWGWNGGHYDWNGGYWATSVGFYGGINYGAGYFGIGYVGGRWFNGAFQYNTYVTRVNPTVVRNVYVTRNVYINNYVHNTTNVRVSYNGGPHGLPARPTPQQIAVAHGPHLGMTPMQRQHVIVASQDRRLLANVNHNAPPVLAVTRPFSASNPPAAMVRVRPADRVVAPAASAYHAEAAHPAPEYHARPAAVPGRPAAATAPHYAPPAERTVPQAEHVAPAARPAPEAARRPEYQAPQRSAPAYVAPARPAPIRPAAAIRPAPVHPAYAPARPAYAPARPAYAAPAHAAPPPRPAPMMHAAPPPRPAPAHAQPQNRPPDNHDHQ